MKNILLLLLGIVKTSTVKQSSITFIGTIVTGLLGMIFYILVARNLGAEEFAKFSVAAALITFLSNIADVGTNTGIVRFTAGNIEKNKDRAFKFLKLGLEIKIISWVFVGIIGWLVMPSVAEHLFRKPELLVPFRTALIGIGAMLLFSFSTYTLQALQKYSVWAWLNITSNLFRLIVFVGFVVWSSVSATTTLSIYFVFPFLGFFAGLLFIPNFFKVRKEKTLLKEFFSFNKWVALFSILSALSTRLDTFLITRYLNLEQVGIYQVAKTLSDVVPQLVFALGVVVAPKLAGFNGDHKKAISYLRKLQLFVIGLGFFGILFGIGVGYYAIPGLYGNEYFASILPFSILIIAQAIFLMSVPVHTAVIYYFSYPRLFVFISLVHMFIMIGGGWLIIPIYGYIGAAFVVFAGNISNFMIPAWWVYKKFKS